MTLVQDVCCTTQTHAVVFVLTCEVSWYGQPGMLLELFEQMQYCKWYYRLDNMSSVTHINMIFS